MKLFKPSLLLLYCSVLFFCFSCEKEDSLLSTSNSKHVEALKPDPAVDSKNALMHDFARKLAVAVTQSEVRGILHDQVSLKFDGDFDVLVKNLELIRMKANVLNFGQVINQVKLNVKMQALSTDEIDKSSESQNGLTDAIPNVQVSMPVHCENWDPATQIPLVAVVPVDYEEKVGNTVVAYDSEGNEHILSADVEPSFPVLVVGVSERVDENGQLDTASSVEKYSALENMKLPQMAMRLASYPETLNLTHGSSRSLVLEWLDIEDEVGYEVWRMTGNQFEKVAQTAVNDNNFVDVNLTPNTKYWYKIRAIMPTGFSSWSPIMATTASSRSDNEWLKIKCMKFSSSALNAVESWISGSPEIRLRVVQGSESGASTVFTSGILEPKSRSQITDSWWNREVTIFAWSTSVYGTVLTFDWREEDWYRSVKFSLTGSYEDKHSSGVVKSGGSVSYEHDEGADVIGNTSVMWWQEKNQVYDLSGFKWQFVY